MLNERKTISPPKLYDLTTLQRECNRRFKFTAQQTLDIAQSLYENKLITYPRTDSQYLTEDMKDTALSVIKVIQSLNLFAEAVKLQQEPKIAPLLDNSKVSDHYAIIPTTGIATAELYDLPKEQQQVLSLIAGKLLCAVSAPHIYETTKITASCEGTEFTTSGKVVIESGFKGLEQIVQKQTSNKKETVLPALKNGESYNVVTAAVTAHDTQPPKPYTEDTLLSAMERAGNADYSGDTEKKGIGTPATRAATIEGLVKDGYISRAKNTVTATKAGINLVSVVPEKIRSPKLTSDWEQQLQFIERGKRSADSFMQDIRELINRILVEYQDITIDTTLFQSEKEIIGVCPRCGANVVYGAKHKNYYCDNRNCGFALWENNKLFSSLQKNITKSIVKDFLTKGESHIKGFVSKKTGKPFDATVVMKDTGKFINFDLKFDKR